MRLRRALVRVFTDIRAEWALHATARVFFAHQNVGNGLFLGADEFERVPRQFDVAFYRAFANR